VEVDEKNRVIGKKKPQEDEEEEEEEEEKTGVVKSTKL
jgi:hypothetical protein